MNIYPSCASKPKQQNKPAFPLNALNRCFHHEVYSLIPWSCWVLYICRKKFEGKCVQLLENFKEILRALILLEKWKEKSNYRRYPCFVNKYTAQSLLFSWHLSKKNRRKVCTVVGKFKGNLEGSHSFGKMERVKQLSALSMLCE